MKIRHLIFAAACGGLFSQIAFAQRDFSGVEISTTDLGNGIYMMQGAGGNLALSVGSDGTFLVDDQFAPLTEKILAAAKAAGATDINFVINTHWHGDHTGGNENLGATGTHIVAHTNVRRRLMEGLDRGGRVTPPAPAGALPVITFEDSVTFHWNGQTIAINHPQAAHTDGDAFVYFKEADVLHMGDVFFNGGFPFIDLASGGDLDGYIAAMETAYEKTSETTQIIPGHGPLATQADLLATIDMLKQVRTRVAALLDDGMSPAEILAANPLADLDEKWGQGFINADRMTQTAITSLSR